MRSTPLTLTLLLSLGLTACERPTPVGGRCERADFPELDAPDDATPVDALAPMVLYYSAGSCAPSPVQGARISCEGAGCGVIAPQLDDGQFFSVYASEPGEVLVKVSYTEDDEPRQIASTITFVEASPAALTVGAPPPSPDALITYARDSGERYSCRPEPLGVLERWGLNARDSVTGYLCVSDVALEGDRRRYVQTSWSSDRIPDLIVCTNQDTGMVSAREEYAWGDDKELALQGTAASKPPLCSPKER